VAPPLFKSVVSFGGVIFSFFWSCGPRRTTSGEQVIFEKRVATPEAVFNKDMSCATAEAGFNKTSICLYPGLAKGTASDQKGVRQNTPHTPEVPVRDI
jgi:hypothetical protein